jgi:hypothetical protein
MESPNRQSARRTVARGLRSFGAATSSSVCLTAPREATHTWPVERGVLTEGPMNKNSKTWLGTVLVLLAIGAGIWFWEMKHGPVPEQTPVVEATPPTVTPPPQVSLSEGEELLKSLAKELSDQLQPWLNESELLRRVVAATQQISNGESPRAVLGFLQPPGDYAVVVERKKKKVVRITPDPKGYARYDGFAATVTSIDAQRAAEVYGKLKPFAEAAYAEIGRPGTTFDATLRTAIANLRAAPIPEGAPELREKSVLYEYVDPKLEALSPAQKHLLRMGPKNERALQDWLEKLEQSLPPTS